MFGAFSPSFPRLGLQGFRRDKKSLSFPWFSFSEEKTRTGKTGFFIPEDPKLTN